MVITDKLSKTGYAGTSQRGSTATSRCSTLRSRQPGLWTRVVIVMIELLLTHTDIARMRFAYSPAAEMRESLNIVRSGNAMYRPWLSAIKANVGGIDLELLTTLASDRFRQHDFLLPIPAGRWGSIEDELEIIAASPPPDVRTELEHIFAGQRMPDVIRPLFDDPATYLITVVKHMRSYWRAAIEPISVRLRAIGIADVSYRMERFATSGIEGVLADLHPAISFDDYRLQIMNVSYCRPRPGTDTDGLVLIPCAFAWPTLAAVCCGSRRPCLIYPARGFGQLFTRPGSNSIAPPLSAVIGRMRAALLDSLDLPAATTQLAQKLRVTPAAVSQQLKILEAAMLVVGRRRGRLVLYERTAAATALLSARREVEQAG